MTDIVIVGSCVQDLVSYTEKFPRPGESVRGKKFLTNFGGKGANQAVLAARLGARTAMVGKVGMDMFGPPTIENFRNQGINADFVSVSERESTATATITVSDSGENNIVVVLGANLELGGQELQEAKELIKSAKVMCCQLEIRPEITLAALKLANESGVTTIFNPAPGLPDTDPALLKYSHVLCPNENEAEFLSGKKVEGVESAKSIAKDLLEKGPQIVIITLGENGCVFVSKEHPEPDHVPCPKVNAVDTTVEGPEIDAQTKTEMSEAESEKEKGEEEAEGGEVGAEEETASGTQSQEDAPDPTENGDPAQNTKEEAEESKTDTNTEADEGCGNTEEEESKDETECKVSSEGDPEVPQEEETTEPKAEPLEEVEREEGAAAEEPVPEEEGRAKEENCENGEERKEEEESPVKMSKEDVNEETGTEEFIENEPEPQDPLPTFEVAEKLDENLKQQMELTAQKLGPPQLLVGLAESNKDLQEQLTEVEKSVGTLLDEYQNKLKELVEGVQTLTDSCKDQGSEEDPEKLQNSVNEISAQISEQVKSFAEEASCFYGKMAELYKNLNTNIRKPDSVSPSETFTASPVEKATDKPKLVKKNSKKKSPSPALNGEVPKKAAKDSGAAPKKSAPKKTAVAPAKETPKPKADTATKSTKEPAKKAAPKTEEKKSEPPKAAAKKPAAAAPAAKKPVAKKGPAKK